MPAQSKSLYNLSIDLSIGIDLYKCTMEISLEILRNI